LIINSFIGVKIQKSYTFNKLTSKKKFSDIYRLEFKLELEVNNLYGNFFRYCRFLYDKTNLVNTEEERDYKMCLEDLVFSHSLDNLPKKEVYITSSFNEYKDCLIVKLITLAKNEINKTLDYLSETYHPNKLETKKLFISFLNKEVFGKLEKAKHLWRCKDLISIIKNWENQNNDSLSDIAGLVQVSIKDTAVRSKIKSKLIMIATSDSKNQLKRLFDGKLISKPIYLNIKGIELLGTLSHLRMKGFIRVTNVSNIALWASNCFKVINSNKKTKSSHPYTSLSERTIKDALNENKRGAQVIKKSIISELIKEIKPKSKLG